MNDSSATTFYSTELFRNSRYRTYSKVIAGNVFEPQYFHQHLISCGHKRVSTRNQRWKYFSIIVLS